MVLIIHTYQQTITDSRLFELAKESGMIYSKSLKAFWKRYNKENFWMGSYDLLSYMKDRLKRTLLHSASYQGSLQLVADNLSSWRSAKKEWEKHPEKFNGKPIPPHKKKFFQTIIFKKSAIRLRNGYLYLSLAKGNDPIKVKLTLDKPKYVTINYDSSKGWLLNTTLEVPTEQLELNKGNILSIDLGVNRIATTFNSVNNEVITYSGKYIKSLIRLENKIRGETQKKLSKTKFKSKRNNVVRRANRIVRKRINDKKKDFLNKTSKQIVNYCVKNNIGKIVIGDCSDIHTNTNTGKKNNQKIQQFPEQKLLKCIKYKFESISGLTEVIQEHYTSQTCPSCGNRYKPTNRIYNCKLCGFVYDRDGVGSINIYRKYRLKENENFQLNVVGQLTCPIGLKYHDIHKKSDRLNQDCLKGSNNISSEMINVIGHPNL